MVNSESDSNENSFEIFVAEAAEQADPVYEINGMRIWIQPLPADRYNLDHDMTLNEFLALIGILNDPSKEAIYTNLLTGATYILNRFDGNMPFIDVLDLIGYDRNNLEQQFLGNAHRIQIIDTTTILQLQDDTTALFHPDVREEIFYRYGITEYQRSYFSKKVLDTFDIVKLRFQDTFRETIYESAYNILKSEYSEDFGMNQEEWLELVDSKAKDEDGAFTQEFEKIVDLCLKEQVFLNLIELSGAQDQDVNAIFSTLDTYLDENFGSLIEQLFAPLTFEAFIDEVINQVLNNVDNEGFVSFNVPTQEYFEDLISVQDSYKDELVSVYWGSPPPPEFEKATFIESNYKTELDDLSRLFYRIREYLIDQNNRDLQITDTLLDLHSPKDSGTYSRQHLTNVLKDLGLDNEKKLQDMLLNQKIFYKTLLEKIQYNIQNNPNSDFKDYSNVLSGEIGSGKYLTEQEHELVKRLDDVLNEILGYVGYTLLKLGFITFDGNGQIKFQMPQDLTTLAKIIRVLGLNSIAELDTSKRSIMEYIETLIWSMILSGHYMNLMTLDNDGNIKLRKEYTYPGNHFLSGIFENFMGNIPDSIYHLALIWNFMNSEMMETRNRIRETIRIFNDQGVDYWFEKDHNILYTNIKNAIQKNHPELVNSLYAISIATYITTNGEIRHIISINGDTDRNDIRDLTEFIEQEFGEDDRIIVYSSRDTIFVAPKLDPYPRVNHAEVKVLEYIQSMDDIAPNSRVYLSADYETCITCRIVTWQYERLGELIGKEVSIEIFYSEDPNIQRPLTRPLWGYEARRLNDQEYFFREYRPFFEKIQEKYHIRLNIDAELTRLYNRYLAYRDMRRGD